MSKYVMDYDGWADGIPIGEYLKVRDAMHARKREEVVRCRDCKYVTDEGYGCKYFSHYEQGASYRWEDVPAEVEPDGFCAWASRKEIE